MPTMDLDPWPNNAVAGPSRWPAPGPDTAKRRQKPTPSPSLSTLTTLARRPPYHPALPLILLPFFAPAFAAPARTSYPYPHASATPTPTRSRYDAPFRPRADSQGGNAHVVYITSVTTPTNLPTALTTVDERVLPRIITRGDDGFWSPVDNAWKLYGVVGGTPTGDGELFADNNFVIQSSLPRGWGQQSSRTRFYRVPLIAIASVVAAFGIVVIVMILVFQRKKAHRKAKRRTERLRRKAMIAAGYDEDSINGTAAEAAFKEKLAEMERQHRQKKRKDGGQLFVKGKVGRWASGMRKRKGRGGLQEEAVAQVVQEDRADDEPVVDHSAPNPSMETVSDVVANGSFDGPQEPSPETSVETGEGDTVPVQSIGAPYFPPAYRPASVRSYERTEGESSSPNTASSSGGAPSAMDKTRAPGYYPAPATEDFEQALEVVSRAEGKRPMPPTDEAAGDRMRHIATDDKRALERLRLGASAPPVLGEDVSGPSAPHVQVDQDGFEHVELMEHMSSEEAASQPPPSAVLHPDLPAPPRPTWQRFDAASHLVDELHLLPSAPPVALGLGSTEPSAPPAPLAPPEDLDDESIVSPSAPSHSAPLAPSIPTPSAPSAPVDDETTASSSTLPSEPLHTIPSSPPTQDHDDGELESEPTRPETDGVKRVYLPRYEP